jgi:Ca2+:H+ antiporter
VTPNGDEINTSESTEDSTQETKLEDLETPANSEGVRKRKRDKVMPWRMSGKEERDEKKAEKKKTQPDTSHLTAWQQVKNVFFSWINLMLVFVPVGIAFGNIPAIGDAQTFAVIVFVMNFLAIIPLAGILSFATEELAKFIGEVLGGLLNASFGNAVELIVSIIALTQGKVLIVQTSLIGSMLSNLLLVMGMCFAFGGIGRQEQFFNVTVAQTAASLLALAIGGLIIPTAFQIFTGKKGDPGVAPTSRGTAVMLLITYGCYLFFQLKTHKEVYNAPSEKSPKKPSKKKREGAASKAMANAGAAGAQVGVGEQGVQVEEEETEDDPPLLTRLGALITLAGSTVLVALCAEYMVSAIDALSKDISEEFIGLILLPIVGNAAEHATAVTVRVTSQYNVYKMG